MELMGLDKSLKGRGKYRWEPKTNNPSRLCAKVWLNVQIYEHALTCINITLQGTNISHLGKRKIIFKMPFLGDMLVPWMVYRITVTKDSDDETAFSFSGWKTLRKWRNCKLRTREKKSHGLQHKSTTKLSLETLETAGKFSLFQCLQIRGKMEKSSSILLLMEWNSARVDMVNYPSICRVFIHPNGG